MKCKFCLAEIEDDVTVCPLCGKDLTEEIPNEDTVAKNQKKPKKEKKETEEKKQKDKKPKKNGKGMKIAFAVVGLVLLAVILTGAVLHFTGVINVKKWFSEQDIFYKDSYSARIGRIERNGKKVVATLGNQELTNGELQVYYWTAAQKFVTLYGADMAEAFLKYVGLDPNLPLDEQIYDETTGMTFQQFFLEQGLAVWSQIAVLVQLAEDAGYQLPAEYQTKLNNFPATLKQEAQAAGFTDEEAYVDKFFPGSSVEAYLSYNKNNLIAQSYYAHLSTSLVPTLPEMEAYYAQNMTYFQTNKIAKEDGLYHNIRQIYIPVVGDIGDVQGKPTYTQEEWDECLPKAEKVFADYTAEGGGEELFKRYVNEVCYTDYKANGGLLSNLTKHTQIPTNLEESYAAAMKDWYLSPDRKPGDVGMVKDDEGEIQGYQILYYCGGEAIWEVETRSKMRDERINATITQATTSWPMKVEYSKILLGMRETTEATGATAAT